MTDSAESTEIAVVGSPSTCEKVTLNLRADAYRTPLLGHMVAFTRSYAGGEDELALGAVTSVETVNPVHRASSNHANHVAQHGSLSGSGDAGDTRSVTVQVEAVFRKDAPDSDGWIRFGTSLSNSPATGTSVNILSQQQADELMADTDTPAYLGGLRASGVRVPWTLSDFSGPRGSRHTGVLGMSGSGKSAMTAYMLACELRFAEQGQIILDPQGQWATEHGMPFSLQGIAAACGRKVTVARLSSSLRLRKDAPLLCSLLAEAGWFRNLAFGAGSDAQIEAAQRVLSDALGDLTELQAATGTRDWTEADPQLLLTYLLSTLYDMLPTGMVYAGKDGWERVQRAIRRPTPAEIQAKDMDAGLSEKFPNGILDDAPNRADECGGRRWRTVFSTFAALHNLWSPWTPDGAAQIGAGADPGSLGREYQRRKAWGLVAEVFDPPQGAPAPWLVLDLSADVAGLGGVDDDDEGADAAADTHRLLDAPAVKARIMQQILGDVLRVGQQQFAAGRGLNTQITVDEAWQYAGPVEPAMPPALAALSNLFAGACRDARKLGVGFRFILQTATGLREDIWKQLAVLVIGYGLHDQADVKRLSGRVMDAHLGLYRTVPPPEATGRYSFMIVGGGATGLSFGNNPVFLEAFTDPDVWLHANRGWVDASRRAYARCLPAHDTGGRLDRMPGQPELQDPAMRAHASRRRLVDAQANSSAVRAVAQHDTPQGSNGNGDRYTGSAVAGSGTGRAAPRRRFGTVSPPNAATDTEDTPPF